MKRRNEAGDGRHSGTLVARLFAEGEAAIINGWTPYPTQSFEVCLQVGKFSGSNRPSNGLCDF